MIDPRSPDYASTPVAPDRARFFYSPVDPAAEPQVSIVTPFYNEAPAIFRDTARSIFGQSFQQWEWLIVNDASTDATALAALAEFRAVDPRVRVIDHDLNRGPGAARNTGYRHARAAAVVQLDSDDLLEPTAVEKWFWCLESHPEVAFVNAYSVGFGAQEYLWRFGFHDRQAFLDANMADTRSMVRRAVYEAVGGCDEEIRYGLEDWEFWLRCANAGHWGMTLPEYLNWYRRRESHSDRWQNWTPEAEERFRAGLRQRYPGLWNGGFPELRPRTQAPGEPGHHDLPCANRLRKEKRRLLMVVPWLTMGGADKFNLDVVRQLSARGWEVTIATTLPGDHAWLPEFTRTTPDVFVLEHFLRLVDQPRFLRYLVSSRQVDAVLLTNSQLGYELLPYLRAHAPEVPFLDYCHIEEEYWNSGGYPRMATTYQELLDLNAVSSAHLKGWMVERGADPDRIRVCHTCVDTEEWAPGAVDRPAVRAELGAGDRPLVVFAGRLCEQKQPRVLVRTALALKRRGVPFTLAVAGDGPDAASLRSSVEEMALADEVRLLGAVPNQRVRQLMGAADVFFLPSKAEGISLAAFEAMACGVCVVGADVGGQDELVTAECGVLVSPGTEDEEVERYATALETLLRDPERRRRLGQTARERVVREFPIARLGERMVALLDEAARLHRERPQPPIGDGLARACADQAIERVRLAALAEELWSRECAAGAAPPVFVDPYQLSWRAFAYFATRKLLYPYYRRQEGRRWLTSLKGAFKQTFLGGRG